MAGANAGDAADVKAEVEASAVVVGGASGIGAAVVARQRAAGTEVAVLDVADGQDVRRAVDCDVTDPAAVDRAVAETVEQIGVPGIVTITAGIGHSGLLLDVDPDEWDRVQVTNTRGPMLVMRAFARRMIDAGVAGSIVATSSVSARLVDRNMGAYCASKAALSMVVQVAAAEWATHGIRVNAIAPGVTQTPMLGGARPGGGWLGGVADRTPLGRLGQPDDIAEAILALHGLDWVTGQVLECDGGLGRWSPVDSYSVLLEHQRGTR